MQDSVFSYFVNELGKSEKRAAEMLQKLARHPDILAEFAVWVKMRTFPEKEDGAIEVEGQTAKTLFESTYLEPIGAYNFLIYLREKPEEALADLKKGLPRK
ncbi:MAG: hypothetical protein ACOYJX_09375 [Acutalibacteraceae bacterium]|jgi:hypothetical protein